MKEELFTNLNRLKKVTKYIALIYMIWLTTQPFKIKSILPDPFLKVLAAYHFSPSHKISFYRVLRRNQLRN